MLCWWCCHAIVKEPLHLPYKLKNDQFFTKGQFCSWECMKAYSLKNDDLRNCNLITLYRKRVYGSIDYLKSAPSRFTLAAFGGTLSIEEFRSGLTDAWVSLPNEVHMKPVIISQQTSEGDLVLKRNKPLKRDKNNIKNALGINLKK